MASQSGIPLHSSKTRSTSIRYSIPLFHNMGCWQVFSLSLCLLFLCHGSTADQFSSPWMSSRRGVPSQQQCRLERLNALEPKRKVESEAGITEYFDENDDQCQCAGLTANRRTIRSKGLVMPFYSNAHRLVYILQGSGIAGGVLPGCPETFQQSFEQPEPRGQGQQQQQEKQQGQQQGEKQQQQGQQQGEKQKQQGQQQQQSQRSIEQHQRVIRFRQGDVLAVPAGKAHWIYNDGDSSVVAITVLDTGNNANQLDNNPRKFSLAGQSSKEEERSANNIFSGFDLDFLAQALGISRRLAQKLQQGQKGEIVRVERELRMVMPPRRSEQQEEEEEEESSSSSSNGLEQIFCTLRFRENIDRPSRADVYNPQAGRYTHLNGQKLPILNHIQMSATRGVLNQGAILAPHWNINAHSLVYITKGRGRIQIVGDQGRSAFDDELRQGQMVLVPQHYAVVMQARDERFEWIAFKTHANAIANQIVGPGSLFRGLPEDIITNSYQGLSRDEARALKNSISLVIPTSSRGQQQGRAEA